MCEDYRSAIYQFDANGKMLNCYIACGTATAAADPVSSTSSGYYRVGTLAAIYQKLRTNHAF